MLTKAQIRDLRSLRDRKHRETTGRFAVEGEKLVADLIAEGHAIEELYALESWTPPAGRHALPRRVVVSEEEMGRISHFPTPSPVLAVCVMRREELVPSMLATGRTLALDGVQDPGNVGTLIRVADWFGFACVLLSPDCADPHSPKVIQASMGSFARVPLFRTDLDEALSAAKVPVLGCDLTGESVHELAPQKNVVVVIGSEGRGLTDPVRERLTGRVTIPRIGKAESLNAAVAGAIVCAALAR